ncbi:hypothetical protein GASC598I20_018690 [Gilliamella apicola SCGC AB-598-I20]|nr:hypothetical protein GASC598I20_018690 [Gilliamella apicola SCGC AB-598-I20]
MVKVLFLRLFNSKIVFCGQQWVIIKFYNSNLLFNTKYRSRKNEISIKTVY